MRCIKGISYQASMNLDHFILKCVSLALMVVNGFCRLTDMCRYIMCSACQLFTELALVEKEMDGWTDELSVKKCEPCEKNRINFPSNVRGCSRWMDTKKTQSHCPHCELQRSFQKCCSV